MIESKGRFINRPTTSKGRKYDKFFIYVPTEVARDSHFPFAEGEAVTIRMDLDKNRLLVSKIRE